MILTNPLGLLGLLGVPIVLALHLLRERGRTYQVSSLSLWRFLEPEVRGSRFRKIPFSWLLVLDLLIALILGIALARPKMILSTPVRDARHIVILLDTSTSMNARDLLPSRLSRAIIDATSLLNNLGPHDNATVLAFNSKPYLVGDTRQDSFQELLAQVTELQSGGIGHAVEEALAVGVAFLDESKPAEFHVLTDGAFTSLSLDGFSYPIKWHIFGNEGQNQAVLNISTIELEKNYLQVYSRLANFADVPVTRVVSLLVEGNPYDSTNITIPPQSQVDQVWRLSGKPSELTVTLLGSDILREDDAASIGINPTSDTQVIIVSDMEGEDLDVQEKTNPLLRAVLAVPNVHIQVLLPEEYSPLALADLTIFENQFPTQLPNNAVLIVPPLQGQLDTNSGEISTAGKVDLPKLAPVKVNVYEPIMDEIDFSGVRWGKAIALENVPSGFVTILQVGETPVVIKSREGNNQVLALLADLESGSFTKHPSFPLFLVNLIQSVRKPSFPDTLKIGETIKLPAPGDLLALSIVPPHGEITTYVGYWDYEWTDTIIPGSYSVEMEDKSGKKSTEIIGINAGDQFESDLKPRQQKDLLVANMQPVDDYLSERGVELFPWLLGTALLLFILEAALAWR